MTARRTRRHAAPDRRPLLVGAGAVVTIAALAAPFAAIEVARRQLASEPCTGAAATDPPTARFFAAIRLLDRLSALPAVGTRAEALGRASSAACAQVWGSACARVQDPAIESARLAQEARLGLADAGAPAEASTSWRDHVDGDAAARLCGAWSEWAAWVDGHGLDAATACPVCAAE